MLLAPWHYGFLKTEATLLPPVVTFSSTNIIAYILLHSIFGFIHNNGSHTLVDSGLTVAVLVAFASLTQCLHYPKAPTLLTI